jgi:NAD(P)-dependent dehydrogenase (short-subunit alcohol dehydrogenase family)
MKGHAMTNSQKLAVVTGAATGIGAGLSREAAKRGYRVLLADRNEPTLVRTAAAIPGADYCVTDVTDPLQMMALAERANGLGGADLLFNNAGVMTTGFTWEIPAADWDRAIAINVGGVLNGARAFIPRMIARKRPAQIVNTASVGGFLPSPLMAPYSATKFAVVAITEAMQCELELLGAPISMSLLAPGPVLSEIFANPFGGDAHPATAQFVEMMKDMTALHGMGADDFAALVFQGIDRGDYWIVPQPEALDPSLQARHEMIRDRRRPTGSMTG